MTSPSSATLDQAALRERLRDALPLEESWQILGDESRKIDVEVPLTPAAVLVALVPRAGGTGVILTQRAAHLSAHAGQISLPGGRMEVWDMSTVATALRESEEEIGLEPDRVEILGSLRAYDTVTGFRVYPVIGWVAEPPAAWRADPSEVTEVFEVPLDFLLEPANHQRDSYLRNGERRHFFVLPYEGRYIWGATAGILVNFARTLTR